MLLSTCSHGENELTAGDHLQCEVFDAMADMVVSERQS
jgi:hypothetical protein